jgi:hypothetical protein
MTATLPDKPSALIRLALADLAAVEANPRYAVNMDSWHKPWQGRCHVCLAGAVMANTFGADPSKFLYPSDVCGDETAFDRLIWLDKLRNGILDPYPLYEERSLDLPEEIANTWYGETPLYSDDPVMFREAMLAIAGSLESAGL